MDGILRGCLIQESLMRGLLEDGKSKGNQEGLVKLLRTTAAGSQYGPWAGGEGRALELDQS